jgi:hypothetical protein
VGAGRQHLGDLVDDGRKPHFGGIGKKMGMVLFFRWVSIGVDWITASIQLSYSPMTFHV